ncbi:transcriptional regulator ATRX-like isoform X2 [Bradysia coprophila]|uniref:transcriptional regulator ATRX-like isoform X2 n=1 Tax=Bradysia coprophila TaxID=38358 RepID=UPI00187D8A97|nr:transcriptional regulator ATRX-like isoform X2 [Bradysia coprophila]
MDMDSQPSTEIKAASSQYHDNDLVDMNELILDNWNLGADNEAAALQCSQEIKLESYNFLGNRINYEEENFQLDEYPSPENYFKGERNAHQYESEDDEDRQINGVMEITDDHVNGVIEIADESSRDSDVVNLLNSSDEVHNASNLSISANLESIRSDHNYSSQELFAPSLNETIDRPEVPATEPETEPMQEPIDHVNEMQALIASWMHGSSSESKVTILNNLESEIKRIKETVLDIPKPEPSPKTPTNASKDDATPIDANTSIISEDNESDSGYIMSEGHSEPLEYRGDRAVLTESETATEKIDEVPVETLKDLRSVSEEVVAKIGKFSKLCSSGTSRLTDLTECGNDVIKSVVAMAAILKLEIGGCTHEKVTVATDEPTGNLGDANDEAETEVDDSGDKTADERSIDETVGQMVSENGNDGENFPEIVDSKVNGNSDDKIEDDENVDAIAVVEDKQKQLDLKSKKRWLASSSEDSQHSSDDSYSENLPVKRRKKRARTKSSSSSSSSDVTLSSINLRKKNVLLESSDDDQSQNGAASSVELDEVPSSEKDAVKDVDMSNYLLPLDVPVNKSMDSDIGDDIDDANDQRVDSEVEEFFGFDGAESTLNIIGPTSDISIDEATGDGVGNISEPDAVESTCDNIETTSNVIELAFDASEPTGDVVEQNSDVTEHTTDVTEQTTVVTEQISDVTEQTSDITEQTSDVTEQTSDVIEPTCDVTEPTSDVIEPTSDVIEGTSDVTEQISDATEPTPDDLQQTSDVNEPVIEHTFDGTERTSEIEEIIDSKTPYVQSQQWELPEELNYSDSENDEAFERNISPKKEVDVENDLENHNEHAVENEDLKAENVDDENDNGENHQNEEDVSECDTDDEIDRLIDFSNIPTKVRPVVNHVPVYRKKSVSKPKPKEDILDILKDSASQDIESESSSEEDIISEEQFVLQLARQQCLKDSSDSDGQNSESVDDDDDDDEDKSSIDNVTDESNDSKVDRFLKKQLAHEMENHLDDNEKPEENAPAPSKDIPVEEDDVDEVKDEQDLELQSSGIFEPEIELHDGEKPPDKDEDSDAEETSEQKAPEEKKKWKLDKIAFSKNLFSNLDLDDDKNTKATANSDNSDCEMLDISMFKTKKSDGDLDKIIQNQKKRDVSKISSSKVADECISLSSDSDLEIDKGTIDEDSEDEKPTTKSRPMLRNDQLAGETKQAQKEENDRLKRLEKKTERLTQIVESQTEKLSQSHDDSDVILDFDSKQNCAISVHPEIVKNLKEHQIAGVKFMYDCCYGSVDSIEKHNGSGCILAHCMGLGKTLQLIALLHTLIRYPQLKTKKILVICPKSTIMNWADEIQTWLQSVKVKLKVLHFPDPSDINKKLQILREWHSFKADPDGKAGCMLIGYEAFRSLVFYADKSKPDMSQVDLDRIRKMVEEYLLKPGADLVVCDEGHVIKNRKSTTSRAVNKISSRRRIILTGTPIQNNLKEYYSMVNFIKPSFLGTEKEFANLYENPIKEGQHKDSNSAQIRIMKQRSYVLHKKLSKFVQRREAALLKTFLPEKYEYVLFIPMTELQNRLYQHFLDNNPLKERYGGKSLIPDYTFLRKIWTHPKVLENAWKNAIALRDKRNAARRRNMDSDEEPDDVLDSQVGKMSVENDWWRQFIEPMDLRSLLPSNKLRILFEILKLCEQNREKCLIFSAFVAVLDVVEFFMHQIHNKVSFNDGSDLGIENFHGPWEKNHDYYRLDGKTSKALRHAMIRNFNNPGNERVKCFLISAKAGGQGINLVGANRVILLDTSWNPSNDQQNIFRVFRLGQQSKCYIYRLLAMGTMEEKVYSRSVTKQAMSFRVVDEQQIDRHYSLAELAELYTLTKPDPAEQPTPVRPVDNILASLLRNFKSLVYKYHEHDSLLENNSAEDLNEQEKADAWEAYEKDVSMKNQFGNMNITADGTYGSGYGSFGLGNLMNPYSYIPPNLPTSMIPAYLQRMGYTGVSNVTGVEQELMLMSQMYSQFNQSGGTSAYGPLSSYFNSPSSSSTNPLYNSAGASNNYYKSTTNSTSTTSSPTSYSNISSSVFNGLNQLTSSSSSAVAQYNLARYMPSYSGNPSYSPFNMYPTSASATSTNAAQSLATNQPGPNAIKNPLLSNLLPPSTSITKDSFSIPTSVITKASKDVQRAAANTSIGPVSSLSSISLSSNTSQSHQKTSTHSSLSNSLKGNQLMVARASPLSSARSSPLSSARVSPLSSARASPLSSARASPLSSARISPLSSARASPSIASRSSPSINRTSADGTSSLSISRTSATAHKNSHNNASLGPLSITLASNRTSPEPNLIVKDVSAINRSMERKTATTTSKAPAQPIKNFNMGIVYPKAPEKKAFDLSQNDSLLKAAKSQLQQNARPEPQNRISLPPSPSRTANRLSVNRIHNLKSGTRTATTTTRAMDTNVSSSSLTSIAKNHLSSPNLPTNEVTITPTKRPQKLSLPMSAINAQRLASTALIGASSSHKSSPIEINKLNNSQLSVSRVPSSTSITRQLPATSSANASITRQIPNPSSVTNANKITGRLNPPKSIPKFSNLASTMPTLKLISTPSNSNNKTAAGVTSRPVIPAINRNPGSRVVAANNGVKVAMQRPAPNTKVFTASPAPKLVSFTNPTSSSDRKRKLEELIPKNTGVTLIKKPKPREPVEIVELD